MHAPQVVAYCATILQVDFSESLSKINDARVDRSAVRRHNSDQLAEDPEPSRYFPAESISTSKKRADMEFGSILGVLPAGRSILKGITEEAFHCFSFSLFKDGAYAVPTNPFKSAGTDQFDAA
jgi:hypothetical protein